MLVVSVVGLAVGVGLAIAGATRPSEVILTAVALVALVRSTVDSIRAARRGRPGVDVIAALALVGALGIGELTAAAVVAVMLATGQALEARASQRAERDLRRLLQGMPVVAHRSVPGGGIEDVAAEALQRGDRIIVKPGETAPVDGRLLAGTAVLDVSTLTGETVPETVHEHALVASGSVNIGGVIELRSVATAEESTYAGIVRMVTASQADSAPFVRLADRWALIFVPVTLALAALGWLVSGSIDRAVAVLVVATPCPLILAVPVAITAGLARAARRGVIVKGGGALEQLARAETLVFDKTGTVTAGRPVVLDLVVAEGVSPDELLQLAASVEQTSPHVLASSIVAAAGAGAMSLMWPDEPDEVVGQGTSGVIDGRTVRVGRLDWVREPDRTHAPWLRALRRRAMTDGIMTVFVSIDGTLSGALVLEDPVRPDATRTLRALRHCGLNRLVMASGDRAAVAESVGIAVGADEVLAERTPQEKAVAVRLEVERGVTVMVGDGVNDAPALAAADVGVALGARGSSASSDVADVVLTVDRIDRLADAVHIARRSHAIAVQSVIGGMGLAAIAMVAAAAGFLPPLAGAIVQEVIDVLAIGNALRALRPGRERLARLQGDDADLGRRFQAEHDVLARGIRRIRPLADDLGRIPGAEARARCIELRHFLEDDLLPHELAEDEELYPVVARVLGGDDPTAPMSRMHVEIAHLIGLYGRLLDEHGAAGPTGAEEPGGADGADEDDVVELRRVLYGLDAILRLHVAQEEQEYLSLADDP